MSLEEISDGDGDDHMEMGGDGDDHMEMGLQHFRDSVKAYKRGFAIDPEDEGLKSGLADSLAYVSSVFGASLLRSRWWKLCANRRTHEFVKSKEDAKEVTAQIDQQDPSLYNPDLGDERVVQALGVLLSDETEEMHLPQKETDVEVVPEEETNKAEARAQRKAGARALSNNDALAAVSHYTRSINLTPKDHLLYSKRSHAHMKLQHYSEAVSDATMAIQLKPSSKRGFGCLGAAHYAWGVRHFKDALNFYKRFPLRYKIKILKLEDYTRDPFQSIFEQNRTKMFEKLKASVWTKGFMKQSDFYQMMNDLSKNPRCIYLYMTDDRVMRAVCVLLGAKLPMPDPSDKKKFQRLIDNCTSVISRDPANNHMFAQRSRYRSSQKDYDQALLDGMTVLHLKPLCSEGYVLVGDAQHGLGLNNFKNSVEAYKKGLFIHPTMVALKLGLADALAYVSSPFGDVLGPKMWEKLSTNSLTNEFMKQKDFVELMDKFSESPFHCKPNDMRVIQALLVLLSYQTKDTGHLPFWMLPPKMYLEAAPEEETNQAQAAQVLEAKSKGDAALYSHNFAAAVGHYTAAINLAPNNHVLFSKRSSVHTSLQDYEAAVLDAKKALQLKPYWVEGYLLLGDAHYRCGLQHFKDAVESYKKAQVINPTKGQFKCGLEELQNYAWSPFEDALRVPDMFEKLNDNPLTTELMKDSTFVDMMKKLQENPKLIHLYTSYTELVRALYVLVNGEKVGSKKRQSFEGMEEVEQGEAMSGGKKDDAQAASTGEAKTTKGQTSVKRSKLEATQGNTKSG